MMSMVPEKVSVGGVSVMPEKSKGRKHSRMNTAALPNCSALRQMFCTTAGSKRAKSVTVPCVAMMRAPSTSWLPKVWSPSAWVLTRTSIFFAAGTEAR